MIEEDDFSLLSKLWFTPLVSATLLIHILCSFADISSIFHHSILKHIQFYMMDVINIYNLMITTKVFLPRKIFYVLSTG